jgi:TctA family transporter
MVVMAVLGTSALTSIGDQALTFGFYEVADGIGVVTIAVGVFAVGEILSNLSDPEERKVFTSKVTNLFPTKEDLKRSFGAIVRGTGVGAFFGVLPGTTPAIASFSSYMIEKKLAKDPSRFGQGAIEGGKSEQRRRAVSLSRCSPGFPP